MGAILNLSCDAALGHNGGFGAGADHAVGLLTGRFY